MNHKARFMGQPGPGYEIGRRMPTSEEIWEHDCRMWEEEQRQKAAQRARVKPAVLAQLSGIARKLYQDIEDEEAISQAESRGDMTKAAAIRSRVSLRRMAFKIGVDL